MRFATINGITLHYALEGLKDGVPLVFINSLGSDLRLWDKLVPNFADNFSIIRHDKRGHGLSDCPPGPYSIRNHTDDLAGLLEMLKVKDVILIGISVGGMIALDYATNCPQSVRAMVLCDTGPKIGAAEFWKERIEALRVNGMLHMAEIILARWFAPAFPNEYPADYQGYYNMLTRMPVKGYMATCAALRDADLRETVATIKAKTLVLCGAEDLATPPSVGRELTETLHDARFEQIEKAAHLPCVEQPEAMATKIIQFLRENSYV